MLLFIDPLTKVEIISTAQLCYSLGNIFNLMGTLADTEQEHLWKKFQEDLQTDKQDEFCFWRRASNRSLFVILELCIASNCHNLNVIKLMTKWVLNLLPNGVATSYSDLQYRPLCSDIHSESPNSAGSMNQNLRHISYRLMGRYTINRTPQKLLVPDAIRTHPGLVVKHYHQRMRCFIYQYK